MEKNKKQIGFGNRKKLGSRTQIGKKGLPNQDEPQLQIWEQHQHKTQAEPSTFYEECHCGYMWVHCQPAYGVASIHVNVWICPMRVCK